MSYPFLMQPDSEQLESTRCHSWSELRNLALSRPFHGDLSRDNFAKRINWPTNASCGNCHAFGTAEYGLTHFPGCRASDRDIRFRLTGQNRLLAELGRLFARKRKTD